MIVDDCVARRHWRRRRPSRPRRAAGGSPSCIARAPAGWAGPTWTACRPPSSPTFAASVRWTRTCRTRSERSRAPAHGGADRRSRHRIALHPRRHLHNWPRRRLWLSVCANEYVRAVTGLSIRDCTSGFRCWRRDLLARLPLSTIASDGYAFQVEMAFDAKRAGAMILEAPITLRGAPPGRFKAVVARRQRNPSGCRARLIARPAVHRQPDWYTLPVPCHRPGARGRRSPPSSPATTTSARLPACVREADTQLRCATSDYEIIVVNDGSRDGSARVLADLRAGHAAAEGRHARGEPRLRRRTALGVCRRHQGAGVLHRRRRAA